MKDCTFKPIIDKKSEKMSKQNRGLSSNKSYEVLFNKHSSKMERVKKLMREKETREVAECTFAPQLLKQKAAKKGERSDKNKLVNAQSMKELP